MNNFYEVYHLLVRDKSYKDCVILKKVCCETQQSPGLVEFDYKKVMELEDDPETEVMGFHHTHPPGCFNMSGTDVETMKAWVACFGRPLICAIESFCSYDETIRLSLMMCHENFATMLNGFYFSNEDRTFEEIDFDSHDQIVDKHEIYLSTSKRYLE